MAMRSLTPDRIRCLQPRQRSVVCTETCPKRNWICSNSPPDAWQSRAQVRRRSCGANFATPMLLADSFTMCQTAFTVMSSPHAFPTLLTLRKSFPRSMPAAASHTSSCFSPSPEREPFESGLPYPSSRRWPSVPPAAGDDPASMRRLRVFSTHTRAGEPTKRGLVFLSAARDQALAKALAPALQSASCQGERLTSSRLLHDEYPLPGRHSADRNRVPHTQDGVRHLVVD